MIRWFLAQWDAVNRRSDMRILWPICRESADLDHAKAAFYLHAANDPSWTNHYSEQELVNYVDALT